ncbi:MAG: class I SAM-dependent methyltransferase [Thermoleophilia bacterium]|nr:class I SAM-dependent methyltransferase [Thermoleophilia bacterium]
MLNWLNRYAGVASALLDADERLTGSLLDVGSGDQGFANLGGSDRFVGVDIEFGGAPAPTMLAMRVPIGPLPFVDGAFDTVLSLDALEHVPRPERAGFVREICRVAGSRAIIACPSAEAAEIDAMLRRWYVRRGEVPPAWLNEHDEHGLPTRAEVEEFCRLEGYRPRPLAMPNGLLSLMAVIADLDPDIAPMAQHELRARPALWRELFQASADFDSFRVGWVIEREQPLTATVRLGAIDETISEALRCDCGTCSMELPYAGGVHDLRPLRCRGAAASAA